MAWVIESAAGTGKTTIARQLVKEFRGRAQLVTDAMLGDDEPGALAEIAEGLRRSEGRVLVVDVRTAWQPAIDRSLSSLLDDPAAPQLIIFTRRAGPLVSERVAAHQVGHLVTSDMLFANDDLCVIAESMLDQELATIAASAVMRCTGGWPSMAAPLLASLGSETPEQIRSDVLHSSVVSDFIFNSLRLLDDADRHTLRSLIHFSEFDEATANAIGRAGLLDRARDAGVPVLDTQPGWWVIPEPARLLLDQDLGDAPDLTAAAFDSLIESGRVLEAIEACIGIGDPQLGASLLASLNVDASFILDESRVAATTSALGSAAHDEPRIFLVRSWVSMASGNLSRRLELLTEGADTAKQRPELRETWEELQAELAYVQYLCGELSNAEASLDQIDEPTSAVAQARARETRAGLLALTNTEANLESARQLYDESIGLWRRAGQRQQAEATVGRLAVEVFMKQGRYREALSLFDRRLQTPSLPQSDRAYVQATRGYLLMHLGEHHAADKALGDADEIASLSELGWLAALIEFPRALGASFRGDHSQLETHAAATIELLGDQLQHAPGAIISCDLAIAHARCGDETAARDLLMAAKKNPGVDAPDVALAAASIEARVGDPDKAMAMVEELREQPWTVRGGRWTTSVLAAIAASRAGDTERAAALVRVAATEASEVGHPTAIQDIEQSFIATLGLGGEEDAPTSAPPRADMPARVPTAIGAPCQVTMFGPFVVRRDGAEATIPPGHAQTILKALVLNDGYLSVDEAVELLWPDTALDVGRSRLRNVLSRLRASCGPIVERTTDLVRLIPGTIESDFGEWTTASESVVGAPNADPTEHLLLVRQTAGGLLPADRYAEWSRLARHRFEVRLLRLVDEGVAAAVEANRIDEALELLSHGLDIEPFDDKRLDTAVGLLRERDRHADADAWIRRRQLPDD